MTARPQAPQPVPPPPLTSWGWTWRYLAVLTLSGLVWSELVVEQWETQPVEFWVRQLAAGVVAIVLYHYRRRWPMAVVTVILVLSAFSAPAAGPAWFGMVSLATRRLWREIIPIGVLGLLTGVVYYLIEPQGLPWVAATVINLLAAGSAIAAGMYIGARRELVATLRDRAERAEREQSLLVAQARANERARIAREMHDVLAHRISLLAMHAGALGYRDDLSAQETAETAGVIQHNAHRALSDLREILGVLRSQEDHGTPERPQPSLADLDDLLADERNAGARIRLRDRAHRTEELPESVSRHAYRILQESLTNARKHAPRTAVDVVVAGEPGRSLILLVRNPLPVGAAVPAPGAGLGLVGLTERAQLSGGRLDHRVSRGHFTVRARLPWPA